MSDVTGAVELIDRVAQKITRLRGVASVTYNDRAMGVLLANGARIRFTIDVEAPTRREASS